MNTEGYLQIGAVVLLILLAYWLLRKFGKAIDDQIIQSGKDGGR